MAKWSKNHRMAIGAVLLLIGLALTVVSWTFAFADATPSWLEAYEDLVIQDGANWNLVVFLIGPILLIWGAWYIGEQILYRRRFERLLDTPKRSEFSSRRRELEDITKRLPDHFGERLRAKESEFASKRA